MNIREMSPRLRVWVLMLCAIAPLSLLLTTGCGEKTNEAAGSSTGAAPAPSASSASVSAGGRPVPGNPKPDAAAGAAAFEAARKKAEGK